MLIEEKKALLEAGLERAAEQVGDVTRPVMDRYYLRFPEARTAFEQLWPGKRQELEGEMVERVLYCLMTWFESPGEIEILMTGSVLHHNDTLRVPPDWFSGLIEETAEVIVETIPPANAPERAVWEELRRELHGLVEQSRKYVWTQADNAGRASSQP
jgi:hypothetical protein